MDGARNTDEAIIAIPARLGSERLPGKPLLLCGGKPLLWHTWQGGTEWLKRRWGSDGPFRIFIVTDSDEIAQVMRGYGAEVLLDKRPHRHGSARIFGALANLPSFHTGWPWQTLINLQCDEPELGVDDFEFLYRCLWHSDDIDVATLASPFRAAPDRFKSTEVKIAVSDWCRALYFTRQAVPRAWRHVGVYAFKRDRIEKLAAMGPCELSLTENLEQLEWLNGGAVIGVARIEHAPIGVNTREDLGQFRLKHEASSQQGQDADTAGRETGTANS